MSSIFIKKLMSLTMSSYQASKTILFSIGLLPLSFIFVNEAFSISAEDSGLIYYQYASPATYDLNSGQCVNYPNQLSNINFTNTPKAKKQSSNFTIGGRSSGNCTESFGDYFAGEIYVPAHENVTFYLNSDDGSQLFVNGNLVVDNDDVHAAREVNASINLTQGWHFIEVKFFNKTGGYTLEVNYSSSTIGAKQIIPPSALRIGAAIDTDGDGSSNYYDNDDDGDGISDSSDKDVDGDQLIEISSLNELNEIRNNLTGQAIFGDATGCTPSCNGFELTSNLNFDTSGDGIVDANDDYWNAGLGWQPIGTSSSNAFTAKFNGNSFTLSRLTINRPATSYVALFGYSKQGADISNLQLQKVNVVGKNETGAVVGDLNHSSLTNITVTGSVQGNDYIGGIVGYAESSVISQVAFIGQVNATGGEVGGIVGGSEYDSISQVAHIGPVKGHDYVSGIVGSSYSNVSDVLSAGQITGNQYVAGIAGYGSDAIVRRSYNISTIHAQLNPAGVVAWANGQNEIVESSYYLTGAAPQGLSKTDIADTTVALTRAELSCPQASADNSCSHVIYNDWDDVTPIWHLGSSSQLPGLLINGQVVRSEDYDQDGINDEIDLFPAVALAGLADIDNDGAPDACDTTCLAAGMWADDDNDNDGVVDTEDAFPLDSTESIDTDGDGIGNNADTDDDNDSVVDSNDAFPLDATEHKDTDGDTVGDHKDFFPNDSSQTTLAAVVIETGRLFIDGTIDQSVVEMVTLKNTFIDPVVITFVSTFNDAQAVDARIANVTPTSFEVFLQQPDGAYHNAAEQVHYMVVERGRWTLANGLVLEAGSVNTANAHVTGSVSQGAASVSFNTPFTNDVVLVNSLNTNNNKAFMSSRADSLTVTGFNIEQEAVRSGSVAVAETIAWVAFEKANGAVGIYDYFMDVGSDGTNDGIDDSPHIITFTGFTETPTVLSDGISLNGWDGFWARSTNLTSSSMGLYAEEDRLNGEQAHADESFATIAFEKGTMIWMRDSDGDYIDNAHDTDDDNDGWSDVDELACGASTLNAQSVPTDNDGDTVCDAMDTDDDNDGMPDTWESRYGLDPLNTQNSDAGNDADGDGISNLNEYLNGTDPTLVQVSQKESELMLSPRYYRYGVETANAADCEISSTPVTYTIENKASDSRQLQNVLLNGTSATQFGLISSTDHCSGQSLAAGSSCTFQVVFCPTSTGNKAAMISITTDDIETPILTSALFDYESNKAEALRRLPPVVSMLTITNTNGEAVLDGNLIEGEKYDFEWQISGYHDSFYSLIAFFNCQGVSAGDCGASSSSNIENSGFLTNPAIGSDIWNYNGITAKTFTYSYQLEVPSVTENTELVVRFYRKSDLDVRASNDALSLMIPGKLDANYYDSSGRRISFTIVDQ